MTGFGNYGFGQQPFGLPHLVVPTKSKVFISYHHDGDQAYYDRFVRLFDAHYEIITDTSLERRVDSDDVDYQQRVIREEHVTGSSVTIVLCGPESWKRRWIDWEIHMTLNKQHALLGIALPTAVTNHLGQIIAPDRLVANINSGYAHWMQWTEDPQVLRSAIDTARIKARVVQNIRNSEPRMQRSRS
ncbi:MAG: TIR domain-containing protein [Phycisphaerales bacterium]